MAIIKKTNSNYLINAPEAGANITLESETIRVVGNLVVTGLSSSITSTNTEIEDNVLRLNIGEPGAGVTLGYAGVAVDRGTLGNVSLIFNESVDRWQITTDGTTFANILTSIGSGAGLTQVADDPNPFLGGNLGVSNHAIVAGGNGIIEFDGNIQLNNSSPIPNVAVSGATIVYADTPGQGQSGVYVLNGEAANKELITKSRSFAFSLIL